MVRHRMRNVPVRVRILVAIIMSVVMKRIVSNQIERITEMSLGREMDGNETDVENEQQRGEQTTPPTRQTGRAMAAMRLASVRHQFQESSFPTGSLSTIEFKPRTACGHHRHRACVDWESSDERFDSIQS